MAIIHTEKGLWNNEKFSDRLTQNDFSIY